MGDLVFLSYSHEDKGVAERVARALTSRGVEVWWDEGELAPGDSLVQKIFESGLGRASHFIVLLSPTSVRSSWVKEELGVATVKRIEELVRVIPVVIDDVDVPMSLRSLVRVDLRDDIDAGLGRLADAIQGISQKPSVGSASPVASMDPVPGMSRAATAVAKYLIENTGAGAGGRRAVQGPELAESLELDPHAVNDAVAELEDSGAVRVARATGSAPFRFFQVEPTYVVYRDFVDFLRYSPDKDVVRVAVEVASLGQIGGKDLDEQTGLGPDRLNRAVEYLSDYALVEVDRALGTAPYTFLRVRASHRTRQFAQERAEH